MKSFMQRTALLLAAAVGSTACVEDIPDLNDPSEDSLTSNPPLETVQAVANGLLIGARERIWRANGYIALLGIVGRESYNLDAADPRFVTEMLEGPLDFSSLVFGGGFWIDPYANIRTAGVLIGAADDIDALSDTEAAGVRGFALAIQAVDFFMLIKTRDELGAVIDVNASDLTDLGPVRCKPAVLDHIIQLLTDASAELANAGESFAFPLSAGFAGFDTPATFQQFVNALLARVHVYDGNFQDALDALENSFIVLDAEQLDTGVYHSFGTGAGDSPNQANTINIVAHPQIRPDAETNATSGMIDARVTRKLVGLAEPVTRAGLASSDDFTFFSNEDPIAIIRNEELILLRAEANLGLGNTADAADDINWIRVNSGGLETLPEGDAATEAELLRQRRYSLMYEGHRWVDTRRLGDLAALLEEDEDRPDNADGSPAAPFFVPDAFPIPEPEVAAQTGDPSATVVACQD